MRPRQQNLRKIPLVKFDNGRVRISGSARQARKTIRIRNIATVNRKWSDQKSREYWRTTKQSLPSNRHSSPKAASRSKAWQAGNEMEAVPHGAACREKNGAGRAASAIAPKRSAVRQPISSAGAAVRASRGPRSRQSPSPEVEAVLTGRRVTRREVQDAPAPLERQRAAPSGRRALPLAGQRQCAEAGEPGEHHRRGRGFGDSNGRWKDRDRAVAGFHARMTT
jgi:hypothetical protein